MIKITSGYCKLTSIKPNNFHSNFLKILEVKKIFKDFHLDTHSVILMLHGYRQIDRLASEIIYIYIYNKFVHEYTPRGPPVFVRTVPSEESSRSGLSLSRGMAFPNKSKGRKWE